MASLSTLLILFFLPSVHSAFTQNVCWSEGFISGIEPGCIQKASNDKFCYFPLFPGTDASCSTQSPVFSGVMAAHLAQGHSIAYYGPDDVFVGDSSWPYPSNPGIIYLCASGAINGAYQSFCTIAAADNAVSINGGFCIVGLPMTHVDDGCYDPSLAVVNASVTTSPTLTLPSDGGINQTPPATAHGPVTTVTVTAQSSSQKASSPRAILIIGILIFVYQVALV